MGAEEAATAGQEMPLEDGNGGVFPGAEDFEAKGELVEMDRGGIIRRNQFGERRGTKRSVVGLIGQHRGKWLFLEKIGRRQEMSEVWRQRLDKLKGAEGVAAEGAVASLI